MTVVRSIVFTEELIERRSRLLSNKNDPQHLFVARKRGMKKRSIELSLELFRRLQTM